jgi:hypothetical protein
VFDDPGLTRGAVDGHHGDVEGPGEASSQDSHLVHVDAAAGLTGCPGVEIAVHEEAVCGPSPVCGEPHGSDRVTAKDGMLVRDIWVPLCIEGFQVHSEAPVEAIAVSVDIRHHQLVRGQPVEEGANAGGALA